MKSYDIVMIGHVSKDILVFKGEEERLLGGAVLYSSASAGRSGAAVLVVTKLASSDRDMLERSRDPGVEMLVLDSPRTTSIKIVYESEDRERRKVTLLSRASPFKPEEIPEAGTRIFHLAGLFTGEIPDEIIHPLARRAEMAIDAQGFLRSSENGELVFRDWDGKEEFLPEIAYLKTDAAEAEILTGKDDRGKAALILHEMGAREVMVTHHTEVLVCEKKIYRAPFNPGNLSGRTGRGDTCFAAYLAWRLSHGIEESVRYAAALTSLKMEIPGIFRGSIQDVFKRMR